MTARVFHMEKAILQNIYKIYTTKIMHIDFTKIFPGVSFGTGIQIIGIKNITIGQGSCIGESTWINVCHRDDKKHINIGSCVLIWRNSMISSGGYVEIGDYCLFAPRVFVSDADHVYSNIIMPYMDQGATSGNLVIEENCWLGINTVISGNIIVGRGCVIGANSVVTHSIPPFCVVAGAPAHIIKIFDFASNTWIKVRGEEHIQELLESREKHTVPSREEYALILKKNTKTQKIDPIVGGGYSI